ncbi:unnamed protein product [Orchesella dallaii]|uniref:CRAL-TRIO domain-containing protein n=1 Tax=Orchesella dallaii TaxID=48710 RepID=A0ABP1QMN9_9HEXA
MNRTQSVELTTSQNNALQEFRGIVKEFLPEEYRDNDAFLLRWLVAREFNLEKAGLMLKNYMEWKEVNMMDKILDWCPPDEMRQVCPFQVIDCDFEGRPVLIFPWGRWKPEIFTDKFVNIYQKYMDYMINSVIAHIKPPATQFVIVGDSDGFTYGHMKYIKALEVNIEAVKSFEAHYPELLHSAIVINCPRAFTLLYSMLKPLMSRRTKSKIRMFGSDEAKWKEYFAERIPQNVLPVNYRVNAIPDEL